MCAASEAITTCFNNCPKDTRGATYRSQVTVNCQNASLYGTAARHAATATDKTTTATRTPSATTADATDSPTTTGGQSATGPFVQNTDETGSPNVGVASWPVTRWPAARRRRRRRCRAVKTVKGFRRLAIKSVEWRGSMMRE
ncbi:predicted protein [Verticillium alfalfae VaMs.102]|uniref:Predicted protein n=1 Tax=Verticillium alfalfae (strain VaMs.102 / ATCC MYA-4576 / FGSC 10136) TaxID=526221 RepID=C9S621_VERA1|nr:predicted protein [Verticillium alfalfae VaMs.102]EEY14360.1 predicted protein [Verticillium alfalfae VaMs.102]